MNPTILLAGAMFCISMYAWTRSPVFSITGLILFFMGLASAV
jgi:hypothetical protein